MSKRKCQPISYRNPHGLPSLTGCPSDCLPSRVAFPNHADATLTGCLPKSRRRNPHGLPSSFYTPLPTYNHIKHHKIINRSINRYMILLHIWIQNHLLVRKTCKVDCICLTRRFIFTSWWSAYFLWGKFK